MKTSFLTMTSVAALMTFAAMGAASADSMDDLVAAAKKRGN